jgi:hypothetical protein
VRAQYNFFPGEGGLDAWDVRRLVVLSADLPIIELPLSEIAELDANYWSLDSQTTVRDVAEHVRLVNECDLAHPIILAASGRVMDGMHRVVRALLEGRPTISARRFEVDPEPDVRGVTDVDALDYD